MRNSLSLAKFHPMNLRIEKVTVGTVTFSAVVIWIGFYCWRIMFNNFAVEVFEASPEDVGLIQAAREIPGLLAFGVGALALYLSESKIAALSILAVGFGLIACGASSSLWMLGFATILMSFGFHYFEPTNSSQLLLLSGENELGRAQGKLRSYESMAGLAGAALILGLTLILTFRQTFYLIGGAVVLIGFYLVWALPSNRSEIGKRRMKLQKKYSLYYSLAFLRGCRRHIFTTFALFLLVKNHNLSITEVSLIMLANNLVTIFTNRWLGKLTDSLGEKTILVSCSFLLILVFSGYAYVTYLPFLIGLFLVDNILFGSSIALKSYVRKISNAADLTSCLSFGMTANHVSAVVIPIAGGIVWSAFGYRAPFIAGAVIVAFDMLLALRVPSRDKLKMIE